MEEEKGLAAKLRPLKTNLWGGYTMTKESGRPDG